MYYDDTLAPEVWEAPDYAYFPDIEMVHFRTGWGNNDISLTLKSGPPGGYRLNEWIALTGRGNVGHDKPDAQNITIGYKSKRWGDYPPYVEGQSGNVDVRLSRYHNTLIVDGKGQNFETNGWGQPITNMANQARVSEFFGTDNYGFTTGDAKNAYQVKLSKFDRDIFYVDGRYYVSFDDIAKNSGTGSFEYLFHNRGTWTGNLDDGYVIDQDGDKMSLYVRMPVAATATLLPPESAYEYAVYQSLGSELAVKNTANANSAQFASVYFPQVGGETLLSAPVLTQDSEGLKMTVNRAAKTDYFAVRSNVGNITMNDLSANAETVFYTKSGSDITNTVMINGNSLYQTEGLPVFSSTNNLNLRYQSLASPNTFKFYAQRPKLSDATDTVLNISQLVPNTLYNLSWEGGQTEFVKSDGNGLLSLTIDASQMHEVTVAPVFSIDTSLTMGDEEAIAGINVTSNLKDSETSSLVAILGRYKGKRLIDVVTKPYTLTAANPSVSDSFSVPLLEGEYAQLFLWDSTEYMKPLIASKKLSHSYLYELLNAQGEGSMTVYGTTEADVYLTLVVRNDEETIVYLNQTLTGSDGSFAFEFPLEEYGSYEAAVGTATRDDVRILAFDYSPPAE